MNKDIEIIGIKIHQLNLKEVISQIENFIRSGDKHQVSVINVYSVVMMQKDEEFKKINNFSSLVAADGMPLVWVSRFYRRPIPERVSGSDIFYELCKIASEKQYKFFFLGSTTETLNKMCLNLKKRFSNLQIAGTYSPPFKDQFSEEENIVMISKINEAKPDLLWIGMTAPKQEKWIYHNLGKLNVPVAIGIGAAFDFIAGNVKRAPKWMQKIGMEWFYRLCQEPKRLWKRYLIGNTIFIWLIIEEFIRIKILRKKVSNW